MTAYPTPDVRNLVVGKANVYFTPEGGTYPDNRVHMGNVTDANFEPTIETLEHFSSMAGVRLRDRVEALQKTALLSLTIEEMTPGNLAIASLGTVETDSDGNVIITGLTENLVRGRIDAIMSNDIGPRYHFTFPAVAMRPAGPIGLITEEWWNGELEGDIEATGDPASFWTATLISGSAPSTETDVPTEPVPGTETEQET